MENLISMMAYDYLLPEDRIAQSAAEPRDGSKLLVYQGASCRDHVFTDLPNCLPKQASLFFNNAKVIPARVFLKNSTGANIEVFLLQPFQNEHVLALNAKQRCTWSCLIGNKKKWKSEEVLSIELEDTLVELTQVADSTVEFSWQGGQAFVELLEKIGKLPLPPYIKHEANDQDNSRYQTVYSEIQGSVAAPTAGLHFTDSVLEDLNRAGVKQNFVTLHVSAGTFLPVKVDDARAHNMHSEVYAINRPEIESVLSSGCLIAVGTTSTRVLESLYWVGVNLIEGRANPLTISQFAYEERGTFSVKESLEAILNYMDTEGLDSVLGETSIMIVPGYEFKIVKGLITNFHQPKSTLLLLISAFIGENWKTVYAHALDKGYRFLSYGDSSLLLP